MALIALAADKGSPGVTTTAVALAAVWPRRAVLAECDPAGGDLVYRCAADHGGPLDPNVGMISLAATARRGLDPHQLWQHVQRVHGGLEVITGIAAAEQAAGLAGLWPSLGRALDSVPGTDVFADCGRVGPDSPSLELLSQAAAVVLVARATAEQVAHLRDRAAALSARLQSGGAPGPRIEIVLIVDPRQGRRTVDQVNEVLRSAGIPSTVLGAIADDPAGADLVTGRRHGRPEKSLLVRSVRQVALDLHQRYCVVDVERR